MNESIKKITSLSARPYETNASILGYMSLWVVFFLVPVMYSGVAFSRFLLRVLPPQPMVRIRFSTILLSIASAIACAVCSVARLSFTAAFVETRQAGATEVTVVIFAAAVLTWSGVVIITTYVRRLKPHDVFNRPTVLFLRRFSSFSDREVISAILRQTPLQKSAVFLTPTRSRAADWNPFLVGFGGLKFLHPFLSIPIVIRSPQNEWEQAVESLILRSQIVILDISDGSKAIETEFEMICRTGCWAKMIFLKDKNTKTNKELEEYVKLRGVQIIYYSKSWVPVLPRMVLGFVVLALTQVITMPVYLVTLLTDNPIVIILDKVFGLFLAAWLFYSFFIRPSIDSITKASLKNMLWADIKSIVSQPGAKQTQPAEPER